ncbi:MAG: cytochrome C [Betaproteobacteria bacterium HGW-Betaproteobacteria-10]|nr:MAG: cytochrome C [Betaproteobacteria bacterium HGW-Betaproteobacteria-10]
MKKILLGAFVTLALGAFSSVALIQSGALDFAADAPHSETVTGLITWAREQSIRRAAADLVPPSDLSDPDRVRRGAGNYEAMCAQCHLVPGVSNSELRQGLYPAPPNLLEVANAANADARRFWIIKHGIKASGMPAWSKSGMEDGPIWDLVAFVKVLPGLSPEAYKSQVAASDGHHHDAPTEHTPLADVKPKSANVDAHKGHTHKH